MSSGKLNAQYPTLKIKYTKVFHDRFLILDRAIAYHVGASLKDAGIIKDIWQMLDWKQINYFEISVV